MPSSNVLNAPLRDLSRSDQKALRLLSEIHADLMDFNKRVRAQVPQAEDEYIFAPSRELRGAINRAFGGFLRVHRDARLPGGRERFLAQCAADEPGGDVCWELEALYREASRLPHVTTLGDERGAELVAAVSAELITRLRLGLTCTPPSASRR